MTLTLLAIDVNGNPRGYSHALPQAAQHVCDSTLRLYQREGFEPPWVGYLAQQHNCIVGACAFKSSPNNNHVEIAYYTFAEYEGTGVATAMARALIKIARQTMPGIGVTAQTEPRANASSAILLNLGFRFCGKVYHAEDGEVWEWRLAQAL